MMFADSNICCNQPTAWTEVESYDVLMINLQKKKQCNGNISLAGTIVYESKYNQEASMPREISI